METTSVPTSQSAKIVTKVIRLTVTPSDHTSEECQQPRSCHTSGARVGRLWTHILLYPSCNTATVSVIRGARRGECSLFPRSPTLTTGEGVSMLERKKLLGLMSNRLAVNRSQTKRHSTITSMYCTILRFKKHQSQQD